ALALTLMCSFAMSAHATAPTRMQTLKMKTASAARATGRALATPAKVVGSFGLLAGVAAGSIASGVGVTAMGSAGGHAGNALGVAAVGTMVLTGHLMARGAEG